MRPSRNVIGLPGFIVVGFLVTLIARRRDRLTGKDASGSAMTQSAIWCWRRRCGGGYLPTPPTLPGFELAAAMHPGHLLGRELYDFFGIIRGHSGCS